jgi:cytochrome P450
VSDLDAIDLTDAGLYAHGFPHDAFTRLRREAPVYWQEFPPGFPGDHDPGFWVLSRHDDVQTASRDPELFCSYDGPTLAFQPETRGLMLVTMDGKAHARQRRLISAGFTPRMVGRLEEQARAWAIAIVERALELGTCNFVQEVAYQLPMHMIADIVGIPLADRDWLFGLTSQIFAGVDENAATPDEFVAIQTQLFQYAQELGRRKRAVPEDDVWTILSTVEIETDDGERTGLAESELDLFFFMLTAAGSETTRNAITGGLMALVDHPDQMERLRRDSDVMRTAVDEILRWTSPVVYFARRATRDTEMRGVPIARGDRITVWYPSANRDEDVFDAPFAFDIARSPNNHVAFGGGGPHYCLGANLARREIAILFEELLARTNEIEIVGAPVYSGLTIDNPVLGAVSDLPVRMS